MTPLAILSIGVATVLGLILVPRLNAFVALMVAALVVSFLAPAPDLAGPDGGPKTAAPAPGVAARVAQAFGESAGKIGVPIAMASIIGACLTASGAADRLVGAALALAGERRAPLALASSGFALGVPVFFDTVFLLLVPLAKSLYRRTGRHYLRYLLALGCGASLSHTLAPPTPGPLLLADLFHADVGLLILLATAVSVPALAVALAVGAWFDRHVPLANPPALESGWDGDDTPSAPPRGPGLFLSGLPVALPVVLVASQTVVGRLAAGAAPGGAWAAADRVTRVLGDPTLALTVSALVGMAVYAWHKRPSRAAMAQEVEQALLSAGMVVLITAAGGAFGAMLKVAQVGGAIQEAFAGASAGGVALLWLGFAAASVLKFSQGSSTVAMITAGGVLTAVVEDAPLPFNPAYLALAIGCGSQVGAWMNDSGFWLICRLGGLTEVEGLKTWSVTIGLTAFVAMLATVCLAIWLPLAPSAPLP